MTNREKLQEFYAADSTMVKLRDHELYQLLRSLKPADVVGLQEHRQLVELIAALRKVIVSNNALNGENFNATLKSLLSVGDDGLYTDPLRFMFELIQNVDDCDYDDPNNVKLRIIIFDNVIQFEYNEQGFKPLDVFAITGIAEAVKNKDSSKVEIGEKGLGFKSVFGVASSVLIQSGLFSFRLNEENFTIPIPEYKDYTPVKGTRLTLNLKDEEAARKVCQLIKERYCKPNAIFRQNPMLFLNKLTVLEILVDNATKRLRFETVRNTKEKLGDHLEVERGIQIKAALQAVKDGAEPGEFDETIVADRYTLSTLYTKDMCISRYGANTTLDDKKMRLQVIFPALQHLNQKNAIDTGALYSFLPTQIKISAPIIIHAPYKLDASREYVDSQNSNLWFRHTNKQLVQLLKASYADVANRYHEDVLQYIPSRQKNDYIFRGEKAHCLELPDLTGAMLRNERIFWGSDQRFHIRGEVKAYPSYLPAEEQRRIHQALRVIYPLFVMPQGFSAKEYEIPLEEDPYYVLVVRSFLAEDSMSRALPILSDLVQKNGEDALMKLLDKFYVNCNGGFQNALHGYIGNKVKLCLPQMRIMVQFPVYAKVFSRWAQKKMATSSCPFDFDYNALTYDITKLGNTHFDINDVGGFMKKYLQKIQCRCIMVPGDCLCVPTNEVLVISQNKVLDLFASFCKLMDKNSHFDITLRLMEMSRQLNDAENSLPVQEYLQLLKDVRISGKAALGNSYNSYTKLLQQASPSPANFLNELFQNADDCKYPNGVTPTLTVRTSGQNFAISYNEKGFEKHNVRAITAIGESTKKRLLNGIQLSQNTIGEKGIGFKAVFAFAKHVDIHSNGFHFRLRAEEPTIPVLGIEEKQQDAAGTLMEMVLNQPLPSNLGFKDSLLALCLCLRKIKRIVWNTIIIDIADTQGKRTITINGEKYEFGVYTHNFKVTDTQALHERRSGNKDISLEQKIICYIPAQRHTNFYLYNGLPTKIRINIPMFIDAPFELTTARDNVLDNNWNKYIRDQVYRAIYGYTNSERENLQIRSLRYVAVRVESNIYRNNTFEANAFMNGVSLKDYAQLGVFVPTVNKQLRRASETRKYPAFIRKWMAEAFATKAEAASALSYSDDEYNASYFYLGGQDAKQDQILSLLERFDLSNLLADEQSRKQLYSYLEGIKTSVEIVRRLRVIPVWCVLQGRMRFVAFDDKPIYRVNGKDVSDSKDYWVLNEQQMSPSQFYAITKSPLEVMDHDHEVQIYKKKLLARINPSTGLKVEAATVYNILLQESSTSKLFQDALASMTAQEQKFIALKNLQGEIVDCDQVFIGPMTNSVFGQMLKHYIACPESYPLAYALNRPKLEEIQYGDVEDYSGTLTNEDLEDLLSTEAPQLHYGRFIAKAFYERGKVDPAAAEKHGLAYYMSTGMQSHNYQFPKGKVINSEQFRAEMRKRIQMAPKMKNAVVEKTVRGYVDPKKGTFTEVNHQRIHDEQMLHYVVQESNKYCFCQMCKAVKRRDYIEVTCIQRELPIHLPMVYLVLCLECSKRYQGLISLKNSPFTKHLYQKILDTKVLNMGNVVIDMDEYEYKDVKLTFTDVHFIQIQTFVQTQVESGSASVSKPVATGHIQKTAVSAGNHVSMGQKTPKATAPVNHKGVASSTQRIDTTPKVASTPVLIQIVGEDAGTYKLLPYDGNIKSVTTKPASSRNILLKKGGAQKRLFVYLVKAENAIYMPRMDYKKYGPALLHVDRIELKKTMYNMGWQK